MTRSIQNIAAFTLSMCPQHQKLLSVSGKDGKHLQLKLKSASKERSGTKYSFKNTIETVSFCGYYPHSNRQNSR
ncbi:MAG: hypothetical protein A2Y07_10405 [Planctomycetes bacterium GWF2_50_10]|nr:MAG: hypothetical protein A2Y07_10405 [Planctomycetes bacterium GWF2_50_10]